MFLYKNVKEQLADEQKKNAKLQAQLNKALADIEYLSMMTDVEMDTETEEMEENNHGEQ
jgi:hypothetical protein